MARILDLSQDELSGVIINTATAVGMSTAIVEKDLWVCAILEYLFKDSPWKNHLAFKGGTSLSKAYNLIERFSEDIDVILDWRLLGYKKDEPLDERSVSQQEQFNNEMTKRTLEFLGSEMLPKMDEDLKNRFSVPLEMSLDGDTVVISYRNHYSDSSILRSIRLEIGARAAWTPTQIVNIRSYIAGQYPRLFSEDNVNVRTTSPERTFWEKVTILHREAYRPIGKRLPQRISRHYYDVYQMAHKGIANLAKAKPELLMQVSSFTDKFYHAAWAHYELAKVGSIRLTPPESSKDELESDYAAMQNMFYGQPPTFQEILAYMQDLELIINT